MDTEPSALIVLAGAFNRLHERMVQERTELEPIMKEPTRGNNILDRLFVSRPCYEQIKLFIQ